MMSVGASRDQYPSRSEYLAHLQQLAVECQAPQPQEEPAGPGGDNMPEQLAFLAEALDRLATEVSEMRASQDSAAGMMLALERRVSSLEQSTPSPQSWRDLIQGIRNIREVVAAQAARQIR
jgi:hypothetical protein